jgi:uncharacterized protein (DUF1697 family)
VRFIAFLRAVNVGGRIVTKDVLCGAFVRAGLREVRTHAASGNVSFDAPAATNRRTLTRRLEKLLAAAAGHDIPVFLRSVDEVERTLDLKPFKGLRVTPEMGLCVIFISAPLPPGTTLPFLSPRGEFELLQATPTEVFAIAHKQNGRPGNPGAYIEKTFGNKTTTRYVSATAKILGAATGR